MTARTPKARFAFVRYRRVFAAAGWTATETRGEGHGVGTEAAPIKRAILRLLDAVSDEHPLGHQPSKAARYVLLSRHAARVEIMFEKNADSPLNLWCRESAAGAALVAASTAATLSVRRAVGQARCRRRTPVWPAQRAPGHAPVGRGLLGPLHPDRLGGRRADHRPPPRRHLR